MRKAHETQLTWAAGKFGEMLVTKGNLDHVDAEMRPMTSVKSRMVGDLVGRPLKLGEWQRQVEDTKLDLPMMALCPSSHPADVFV